MRHVDKPDFLLQDGSDLVVGHEGTAILSPYSFAILLGDVGVDFTRVEDDVQATKRRLARKIGLTATAEASLKSEGLRTRRTAKRLRYLPERIGGLSLDPDLVRNQLAVHGIDPSRVLDDENKFRFTPRDVETFLDLVEGRFFEADFGGERRRADRFSSR